MAKKHDNLSCRERRERRSLQVACAGAGRVLDQSFLDRHVPFFDLPNVGLAMRGKRPFRKLEVPAYASRTIVLRVVRASPPANPVRRRCV